MQGIPGNEDTVIGGDMNGHVSNERRGYERIHGGYSFGEEEMRLEKVFWILHYRMILQ